MYARPRHSLILDDHRLLLNGLQSTRLSREHGSKERPAKRQKTEGMNSHYDSMIRTINVMHTRPSSSFQSGRRSQRKRQLSASSATSYDAPKTPAHSDHNGCFDEGPSIAETKGFDELSVKGQDPFDRSAFSSVPARPGAGSSFYPPWLKGAISSLDSSHPIRSLLPGSSPSAPELDNAALENIAPKESPFAFVVPDKDKPSPSLTMTGIPSSTDETAYHRNDLEESFPASAYFFGVSGSYASQKHPSVHTHYSSPDVEPTNLPFATPGPTATLASNSYRQPPPSLVSEAANQLSTSVSFSLPGPHHSVNQPLNSYLSELSTEPAFLTKSMSLHSTASADIRSSQSSRIVQPFSTPGPTAQIRVPPSGAISPRSLERTPGSRPAPSLILSPPIIHPDIRATHNPIYESFSSARRRGVSRLPSPRSSSVERFLSDIGRESTPRIAHPFFVDKPVSISALDLNYKTLGFKWQKFDRGDIVLDAYSSSPRRAEYSSEEAFWGQPAAHIPTPGGLSKLFDPETRIDSSPGSLRLTRIASSPAADFYPVQTTHANHRASGSSYHNIAHHSTGESISPFTWRASPPRDDGVVPHTPRTPRKTDRRSPGTQQRSPGSWSLHLKRPNENGTPGQTAETSKRGTSGRNPEVGATGSQARPSFAPAPGVYISPLREYTESQPHVPSCEERDEDVHVKEKKTKCGPCVLGGAQSPPVHPDNAQSYREETISQSTNNETSLSRDRAENNSIEEIEEDHLQGYSQESRDTIESWTD